MKKAIKITLLIAVIGVFGFAIWFWSKRLKGGKIENTLQDPPAPQIGSGQISDPETGLGKAAIDRRIVEIKNSTKGLKIEQSVMSGIDIMAGVSQKKAAYYIQNISRPPITSPKQLPLKLSPSQVSAIAAFQQIAPRVGGFSLAENLLSANRTLMEQVKTCYVGNPELNNVNDFVKQVYCQGYQDCGKKYKTFDKSFNLDPGGEQAATDMAKISSNWLNAATVYEAEVRQAAIADLRNSGWKFIGFDN